jgi:AcrR family transcriptional regulator
VAQVPKSYSRGPYRNGIKRREEILAAASDVFAEFGYNGGSLRTIAASVDSSPASLLQHFGSKEGLLTAVLEHWSAESGEINENQLPGLDFFESLRELMVYHLSHRGLIELFLTMAAEASSDAHPARDFIRERYVRITQSYVQHLREARDLGQIALLSEEEMVTEVRTLFAVMDGLELQWLHDTSLDLVQLFNQHLDHTMARWKSGRTVSPEPAQAVA